MKKSVLLLAAALLFSALPARAQDNAPGGSIMETFGAMCAQGMFGTFVAIGELGDLYVAKSYDKEKTVEVAKSLMNLANSGKQSLASLAKGGKLDAGDLAFVNEAVEANDLNAKMAQSLVNVANDPSDANRAAFEAGRKAAWGKISKLLGIE